MFDLGWTELLVIGIVALIVVGPKDLPKMFRSLGQFTAKARGMAREFQRAMDDAADASGVKDVAKDLRNATDTRNMGLDELDKMRKWDPLKDDARKDDPKKASDKRAAGVTDAPEADPDAQKDATAKAQIAAEMARLRQERANAPEPDAAAPTDAAGKSATDKSQA